MMAWAGAETCGLAGQRAERQVRKTAQNTPPRVGEGQVGLEDGLGGHGCSVGVRGVW